MLGETAGAGTHQSKSKKGIGFIPFTFCVDIGLSINPFVDLTELKAKEKAPQDFLQILWTLRILQKKRSKARFNLAPIKT